MVFFLSDIVFSAKRSTKSLELILSYYFSDFLGNPYIGVLNSPFQPYDSQRGRFGTQNYQRRLTIFKRDIAFCNLIRSVLENLETYSFGVIIRTNSFDPRKSSKVLKYINKRKGELGETCNLPEKLLERIIEFITNC